MGNCTSSKQGNKPGVGSQTNMPQGRPIKQPGTPREQQNTPLETKQIEKPLNTARAGTTESAENFSAAASSLNRPSQVTPTPTPVPKQSEPIREKIYNREERYHNHLAHIWTYVKNNDKISCANVFEQYEGHNMGFVTNDDPSLVLQDGDEEISMLGWSVLEVAIALKATKVLNWLLKQPKTLIYARADLSLEDLEQRSPNFIDSQGLDPIEIEIRPLYAALCTGQYKLLSKLWRKNQTWEACHFYRLIHLILQRKENSALNKLLEGQNYAIDHFYDAKEMQKILAEHPETPQNMLAKLQIMIANQKPAVFKCNITQWEQQYAIEEGTWESEVWSARAKPSNHESYLSTVQSIKDLIDFYGIETEIEGCSITPLHFLFAKCISSKESSEWLLQKIKEINPQETNIRSVVQLIREGKDPRKIEEDSFHDGGVFLLWCLHFNRVKMLQYFLGEEMLQFWRFAQLKTLLWACFREKNEDQEQKKHGIEVLGILMRSACMRALFAQLPAVQKYLFVQWGFEVGMGQQRYIQNLFSEMPYSSAFVCDSIQIQNFQELEVGDGLCQFSDAVDNCLLYELDKMSDFCYDDVIAFIQFLQIRDASTLMYTAGSKFIKVLGMTKNYVNAEQEAMDTVEVGMDGEQGNQEDEIGMINPMAKAQKQTTFRVDEFKRMLVEGDEIGIFNMLVTSNMLVSQAIKVPNEALFIDWRDSFTYTYKTPNMDGLGRNNLEADRRTWKGCINMSECNLAHRMIAQGFSLMNTVSFLLEKFTLQSRFYGERVLPSYTMILTKNIDFNKGINKVLKMVTMCPSTPNEISVFIHKFFPVGTLISRNLNSYFKFLVKISMGETAHAVNTLQILRDLVEKNFFKDHLNTFTTAQINAFSEQVQNARSQNQDLFGFLDEAKYEQEKLISGEQSENQLLLIQQIHKPAFYSSESFNDLVKKVTNDSGSGLDCKIRFPQLMESFICQGKIQVDVSKFDVGPLLLALESQNANAFKDLLKADSSINLRQSLRGPIDQYKHNDQPLQTWNYKFTFPELENDDSMTLPFDTLGLAILVDCHQSDKQAASAILASLVLQPSFMPTPQDFVSFVNICLSKRYILLLKAFLMSYKMQFIFCSLPYENQRMIVRMLLGLSPDGCQSMHSVFESSVTLDRPYILIALIEMLENSHLVSKAEVVAKDLLTKLTSEQLVLVSYIDRYLIEASVSTDQVLERLRDEIGANQSLIDFMSKLLQRLKQENLDQGIKTSEKVAFDSKKRTLHGSLEPHQNARSHPQQKEIPDLDMDDLEDGYNKNQAAAGNGSELDLSD